MTPDEVILAHLWRCDVAAAVMSRRIRRRIPLDDLLQYARLGLVRAAHGFDSSRGFAFQTYAEHKIVGAMLDGIRAETKCRNMSPVVLVPLSTQASL